MNKQLQILIPAKSTTNIGQLAIAAKCFPGEKSSGGHGNKRGNKYRTRE